MTEECIKRMLYIYYTAIKKKIPPFATTCMKPEGIMLSVTSQTEGKTNIL